MAVRLTSRILILPIFYPYCDNMLPIFYSYLASIVLTDLIAIF